MIWPFSKKVAPLSARVPDGIRAYAIGDIHGRLDLLRDLHGQILEDSATAAAETRKIVIYVGDYVDRGPDSRGVIDLLLDDPLPGFEAVHLKGNHEEMCLSFLDQAAYADLWFPTGGWATLESYGVPIGSGRLDEETLLEIQGRFRRALPDTHREFLSNLKMTYELGDYYFVHAGIRPGRGLSDQVPQDLLWIRDAFTRSKADHGKVIVHGHYAGTKPA